MSRAEWGVDVCTGTRWVRAEITDRDMVRMRLDRFDHALLSEPIKTGSDVLLDFELLMRRAEELHPARVSANEGDAK